MYESGSWDGHWDQEGLGRQEMHDLRLEFSGDRLTGSGRDCVGEFTLTGEVNANAEVQVVKKYVGRHSVVYLGRHDGEGLIHGVWALNGDNGTWAIRRRGGFRKTDEPIVDFQP